MLPTLALNRWPLRLRLALAYALLLGMIGGAVSLFLLATMENDLMREADETLALRATHVAREIAESEGEGLTYSAVAAILSDILPLEEYSAPGVYVEVLDPQGEPIASSPNLPGGQLPIRSALVAGALSGQQSYETVLEGDERVRELARPVEKGGQIVGVILVGESLHLLDSTLRRMLRLLGVAGITGTLACLVAGWWLSTRALRPITEVTQTARAIASTGRFERRLSAPPTRDEVGELVATFNDMLARLEKTFQHQREFLADASHELRGPLMVIRGNLDLLKLDLPEKERRDSAREAAEEVERMSRLVSDLLFLAWMDAHERVEQHPAELHYVVTEVLARARELDAGSHEILLSANEPTLVLGDRERLIQMLWNLVENALRYTPAGGRVALSLRNHGEVGELVVADTGAGIPAEHLPRIFERFYRVDRARARGQGSTGLGLAIVSQVVEAHGGQVRVRSEPGQGSVFTVALPVHHL